MVLWQGLTEGGTAVPVQVTEAGKVVAEGQQGPPGEDGKEGPQGPKGDQGPQGEYGPGDDVDLGSITATGKIASGGNPADGNNAGAYLRQDGNISAARGSSDVLFAGYNTDTPGSTATSLIYGNGNITSVGSVTAGTNGRVRLGPTAALICDPVADRGLVLGYDSFQATDAEGFSSNGEVDLGSPNGRFKNGYFSDSISAADNAAGITSTGELYLTSRGTRYKLVVAGGLVTPEPYTREMELRERAEALRKPRTTDSVPED